MKHIIFVLLMGLTSHIFSQHTVIPDTAFEKALINLGFDDKMDGKILKSKCSSIDSLNVSNMNIKSLSGIEDFINLKYLNCNSNQIRELNLTHNDSLSFLKCSNNLLKKLNTKANRKLIGLFCFGNFINELDLSLNKELLVLFCWDNNLKKLNLNHNKSLLGLSCYNNQIKELLLSECKSLTSLDCSNNQISTLDISSNLYLVDFSAQDNPYERIYISKLHVHDDYSDVSTYVRPEPLAIFIRIHRK